MLRPFTSARLFSQLTSSLRSQAHRQMSASARYKLTNYTFYATAGFAFAVVAFSTLLPCPARDSPYAKLQENEIEVHRKMLEQGLQGQQLQRKNRRWLEEPSVVPSSQR